MISFAIAEAAEDAEQAPCGVPVAEILPGEGVRLEAESSIRTTIVVCNADPKRALAMLSNDPSVPGSTALGCRRGRCAAPS